MSQPLPPDLARFRDRYAELFGLVPPLPAAKFAFSSQVDPDALRLVEQLRARAFYSDVFDAKTTQLLLFGMLLARGEAPAKWHAIAARRAGASWEELHKVLELAAATAALGPFNQGGALLNEVRAEEARESGGSAP